MTSCPMTPASSTIPTVMVWVMIQRELTEMTAPLRQVPRRSTGRAVLTSTKMASPMKTTMTTMVMAGQMLTRSPMEPTPASCSTSHARMTARLAEAPMAVVTTEAVAATRSLIRAERAD